MFSNVMVSANNSHDFVEGGNHTSFQIFLGPLFLGFRMQINELGFVNLCSIRITTQSVKNGPNFVYFNEVKRVWAREKMCEVRGAT